MNQQCVRSLLSASLMRAKQTSHTLLIRTPDNACASPKSMCAKQSHTSLIRNLRHSQSCVVFSCAYHSLAHIILSHVCVSLVRTILSESHARFSPKCHFLFFVWGSHVSFARVLLRFSLFHDSHSLSHSVTLVMHSHTSFSLTCIIFSHA